MTQRRGSILQFGRPKTSHDGAGSSEPRHTPPESVSGSSSSSEIKEEEDNTKVLTVIEGLQLGDAAHDHQATPAVPGTSDRSQPAKKGLLRRMSTSMRSSLHTPKARRLNSASDGSSTERPTTESDAGPYGPLMDMVEGVAAAGGTTPRDGQSQPASHTDTRSRRQRIQHWFDRQSRDRKFDRRAAAVTASGAVGTVARWNPEAPPLPLFLEPPLTPYDPAKGAAARAAAAEYNANILARRDTKSTRQRPVIRDSESAICLDTSSSDHEDSAPPERRDPVAHLPVELSTQILSFLDWTSLARAQRVSRAWEEVASNQHIWREAFLTRYQPKVYMSPPPLTMGGTGIGEAKGPQEWKRMYQIRRAIERRWLASNPVAIYFNGHTDSVYCCQFDEDKIITGSRDRTIRVWDLHTFKCLKVIGGPAARPIYGTPPPLEVHPSNMHVPNGNLPSINGTAAGHYIYHIPTYYHTQSILCLQFDKEIVVTGSSDNTCIVWDIKTWQPIHRLEKHKAGVLDVCFDDKNIISCSKDSTICVWDRATGELKKVLEGHRGPVNAVQLRGHVMVSASGDGKARLWNLHSYTCIKELASKDRGLAAVEFSDDAKFVLAGGNDQVVYKFDATSGELLTTYTGHTGLVRSLFLDAHNNRVLSGSYDQSIRVYNFRTGDDIGQYENWTTSWILSAKADYRRIVATSQDGRCLLMDFGHGIPGVELLGSNWSRLVAEGRIRNPYSEIEAARAEQARRT